MSTNSADQEEQADYSGLGPQKIEGEPRLTVIEIAKLLTDNSQIDASTVFVNVREARVVLSGFLQNQEMLHTAIDIVQSVQGVKGVSWQVEFPGGLMAYGDTHGGGKPPPTGNIQGGGMLPPFPGE